MKRWLNCVISQKKSLFGLRSCRQSCEEIEMWWVKCNLQHMWTYMRVCMSGAPSAKHDFSQDHASAAEGNSIKPRNRVNSFKLLLTNTTCAPILVLNPIPPSPQTLISTQLEQTGAMLALNASWSNVCFWKWSLAQSIIHCLEHS